METKNYMCPHRPGNPIDYPDEVGTLDQILRHPGKFFPDDIFRSAEMYFPKESDISVRLEGKKICSMDPDAVVTIYRGAPSADLNTGDWVTLSEAYAKRYAEGGDYGSTGSTVHSYQAKLSELSFDGDSIFEFGYWGPERKA